MTAAAPSPRIAALTPPFAPELDAMLKKWMPPGSAVPPLALFRTLAVHPELSSRMRPLGAALLGHGLLTPRERELIIQRTCARAGAEYEWGVHAVAFGAAVGLGDAQQAATVRGAADAPTWTPREQLLLALADELHASATVSAALWTRLAAEWTPPQLLELLVLAGWYRLLSYVINAVGIELEPWAARFPADGTSAGPGDS